MIYHVPPLLCQPNAIRCPRCDHLQHQTYIGLGSHVFRVCDGRPNGKRCNWWLLIIRAGPQVCVCAVTAEERTVLQAMLEGDVGGLAATA